MVEALLQIIATDNVELCVLNASFLATHTLLTFCIIIPSATRQACAVYLKNRVQTSYGVEGANRKPDQVPIPASGRDALKSSILRLLAVSPSRSITLQLGNILKTLISRDLPDRWPGILDDVKIMLQSGDIRQVGAGCVAALECVRAFK